MTFVHTPRGTEINGFGYVTKLRGSNVYYVATASDIFITEQTVTAGSAHVSGTTSGLALTRAVKEGRDDDLRLQWHSHPQDVYFSPLDRNNIKRFGITGEWLISLVVNRQGELRARFDSFRPVRMGLEIEVIVYRQAPQELVDRAQADVTAMVRRPAPFIFPTKGKRRRRKAVVTPATDK